jgi:hypothetical protein
MTGCDSGGGEGRTPAETDFVIGSLSQKKDNITAVTITPKQGKSTGEITTYYNDVTTLPTQSGTYFVTFDVEEEKSWKAAYSLSAGTLVINDEIYDSISELSAFLSVQTANTAETPYYIALNINLENNEITSLNTILNSEPGKYVYLDLSGSAVDKISNWSFGGYFDIDTLTIIGGDTLTGIIIPNSVTSIEDNAFYNCGSLTSVTIPNSVTSIGYSAFYNCGSLTTININTGNTAYSSVDGVIYNKNKTALVTYPAGKADASFVIPDNVTYIGDNAFSYCRNLTSVTIPDNVTYIGDSAFSYCGSLTSVTIPNRIAIIRDYTFSYCSSLASVIIPNNVAIIRDYAFSYCSSLASVTVNDVTNIGKRAFESCTSLTSVTIKSSFVTSIGEEAFYKCSSLTSVIIGNDVISIKRGAFESCVGLTSVVFEGFIPSSRFDADAFYDLGDLRDKFYRTNSTNGTPGIYTRPNSSSTTWTKR